MVKLVGLLCAAPLLLALAACGSDTPPPPTYTPGPLTNSTACGVLTADHNAGDDADIADYIHVSNDGLDGSTWVLSHFESECATNPSELVYPALVNTVKAYNAAGDPSS